MKKLHTLIFMCFATLCVAPALQAMYLDDETDLVYYGHRYYNPSTGRWLSRGPAAEDVGGNNLFNFVGNDPINKSDVLGQYEADFHFYVIYYLLRAKGFCYFDAGSIAFYSQNVDDDPSTSPMVLGKEVIADNNTFSIITGGYFGAEGAAQKLARFHFSGSGPGAGTYPKEPTALGRVQSAFSGWTSSLQSCQVAGAALHTLADTWAHKGFTAYWNWQLNGPSSHPDVPVDTWDRIGATIGNSPVGHAIFGHHPDEPFRRVALAEDAAKTIYDLLPTPSCSCSAGLPWSVVDADLSQQFSLSGSELTRSVAAQAMIKKRFGESPWDGRHEYEK